MVKEDKMVKVYDRWDLCKCGVKLWWDPHEDDEVVCGKCRTRYKVDCDSVLVYWLEEKVESMVPYKTEAR